MTNNQAIRELIVARDRVRVVASSGVLGTDKSRELQQTRRYLDSLIELLVSKS